MGQTPVADSNYQPDTVSLYDHEYQHHISTENRRGNGTVPEQRKQNAR